jgi:hypothetical protein
MNGPKVALVVAVPPRGAGLLATTGVTGKGEPFATICAPLAPSEKLTAKVGVYPAGEKTLLGMGDSGLSLQYLRR